MEVYLWIDSMKKTDDNKILITACNPNVTDGSPTLMWTVDMEDADFYRIGQVLAVAVTIPI